jgi:flagellar basal-body rod modification protein FlgD
MNVNPILNSAAVTSASGTSSSATSAGSATDNLATEQTFLQLLVAQIQNQDPTQPADAIQFVSQLAQFSDLEQNLQMRQDLDQIVAALPDLTGAASTASSAATTSPTASSTNSI